MQCGVHQYIPQLADYPPARDIYITLNGMTAASQLFEHWSVPHLVKGGVTLVARVDCAACLARIYAENRVLLGYEGFTLRSDGKIQPQSEWIASWSLGSAPSEARVVEQLAEAPPEITHFEFVFR